MEEWTTVGCDGGWQVESKASALQPRFGTRLEVDRPTRPKPTITSIRDRPSATLNLAVNPLPVAQCCNLEKRWLSSSEHELFCMVITHSLDGEPKRYRAIY